MGVQLKTIKLLYFAIKLHQDEKITSFAINDLTIEFEYFSM